MKKSLICLWLLLTVGVLFGCTQASNTELYGDSTSATVKEFSDLGEFDKFASQKDSMYTEQGYYYIPSVVPENVALNEILVGGNSPLYTYNSEKKRTSMYDPLEFTIQWIPQREQLKITVEEFAKNIMPVFPITRAGNYAVVERTAASWLPDDLLKDYKEDEVIFKMVWWEQEGEIFQARIPATFTQEDIEKYCVAKKVEVKQ
jgi:hypothetical protein